MFKAVINFEKTHIDEISKQFHLYAWPVVNKDGARIILDEAKIEFCGTVYDPLHIEESEIRLGKLLEGRQYSEEVKIGVESKWEIGIEQEPQYWKIEIHPIKNEAAYQMVLTEKKMIPSGKFKDTLVLWGKNIENIIIYRNMQISGIIEDRVKIEPERIDFGVVSVGEEIVVSLELKNSDESNRFGIRDYEIPHAFEATEATISKDAHTIEISLLPVEAGLVNDVIKIYVKSKYNDEKICIVSVAGIIIKKSQGKEVIQFKHAGDDKVLLKQ
ncbi:hypothetical protein JXA32_16565 [Candidatus Sumerlaeota bacterium]|nr:hypothetical protein [Candidatus Sumerlaeota bacterium]